MAISEQTRLIVATDGSEGSLAAARLAGALVKPEAVDHVTVIAVVRPFFLGAAFGDPVEVAPLPQSVIDEVTKTDEQAAREAIKRTIAALGDLGAKAKAEIRRGRTADEIVRAARDDGTHLIIVGSRGWGEARAVLMGSVSEQVLHSAPCAVLIARPTDHKSR